jgi:hypothetical protein
MPVLINTKKCTSAQICTAFESYLAIFGQIARKRCANAGRWTPDTYRASSVQHLHSGMLADINEYMLSFRVAHIISVSLKIKIILLRILVYISDGQLLKNFHNDLSLPISCILIGSKEIESESSLWKFIAKVHWQVGCESSLWKFWVDFRSRTFTMNFHFRFSDFPPRFTHIQTKHKFVQLQPKHKQPQLQLQPDAEDHPHTNEPTTTTTRTAQLHLQLQHDTRAFSS